MPVGSESLHSSFSTWALVNQRMTESIRDLTDAQLSHSMDSGGWPLWAVIGHAACQRVFWFCDFAGEPGASSTPFTNAALSCPGDEDLDNPLNAEQLVHALASTFAIVDRVLSGWTIDELDSELCQPEWGEDWVHTRGAVVQRVYSHDVWHASQASSILTHHGLPAIEIWA